MPPPRPGRVSPTRRRPRPCPPRRGPAPSRRPASIAQVAVASEPATAVLHGRRPPYPGRPGGPGSSCGWCPRAPGIPGPPARARWRSRARLWSRVLPKPMPGSTHTSATPAAAAAAGPVGQEGTHLGHHVVVGGGLLHGAGRPLHVHGHPPHPGLGRHRPQRGRDVVHERGPGRHGGLGHGPLHGVDRHPDVRRQRLDHRHDPAQLLGFGDGLGPGSARLAPHVHDVGTLARPCRGRGRWRRRGRGSGRRRRTSRG